MKKTFSILLFIFYCGIFNQLTLAASTIEQNSINYPDVEARNAICVDAKSGRILYYKNAFNRVSIASTTKIMTAIIALERGNLNDIYQVSNSAAWTDGSSMGIKKGEKFRLQELLYGLMLKSGNDAAVAIAEGLNGSVEGFAEAMNQKAIELEMKDSHFVTPHGLDSQEHYSTAYDMALLSRYALNNAEFSRIVKTKSINMGSRTLLNTNPFLENYQGVDGVKTGYTGQAGRCLVISASRDNLKIITVILNCSTNKTRLESGRKIMDYVFSNFKNYKIASKGTIIANIPVIKGKNPYVNGVVEEDFVVPLTLKERENIVETIDVKKEVRAPVSEKDEMGVIKFSLSGDFERLINVYSNENILERKIKDYFYEIFTIWIKDLINEL